MTLSGLLVYVQVFIFCWDYIPERAVWININTPIARNWVSADVGRCVASPKPGR